MLRSNIVKGTTLKLFITLCFTLILLSGCVVKSDKQDIAACRDIATRSDVQKSRNVDATQALCSDYRSKKRAKEERRESFEKTANFLFGLFDDDDN